MQSPKSTINRKVLGTKEYFNDVKQSRDDEKKKDSSINTMKKREFDKKSTRSKMSSFNSQRFKLHSYKNEKQKQMSNITDKDFEKLCQDAI